MYFGSENIRKSFINLIFYKDATRIVTVFYSTRRIWNVRAQCFICFSAYLRHLNNDLTSSYVPFLLDGGEVGGGVHLARWWPYFIARTRRVSSASATDILPCLGSPYQVHVFSIKRNTSSSFRLCFVSTSGRHGNVCAVLQVET